MHVDIRNNGTEIVERYYLNLGSKFRNYALVVIDGNTNKVVDIVHNYSFYGRTVSDRYSSMIGDDLTHSDAVEFVEFTLTTV